MKLLLLISKYILVIFMRIKLKSTFQLSYLLLPCSTNISFCFQLQTSFFNSSTKKFDFIIDRYKKNQKEGQSFLHHKSCIDVSFIKKKTPLAEHRFFNIGKNSAKLFRSTAKNAENIFFKRILHSLSLSLSLIALFSTF